jgi:pimeloyl-ACP methyl ester carboxylesterase
MMDEIILVHGLWFGRMALSPLGRRLSGMGFSVRNFKYSATSNCLDAHARELHRFARQKNVRRQHFLGHSLGGLVILRMLSEAGVQSPGRVVLLGSPLGGSTVVRKAGKLPGTSWLFGQIRSTLEQGFSSGSIQHEIGMIAGSRSLGLGLLVGGTDGPGDGTVGLHEARMDHMKQRLVLPVTHTGMLYSSDVARQSAAFLRKGHFES